MPLTAKSLLGAVTSSISTVCANTGGGTGTTASFAVAVVVVSSPSENTCTLTSSPIRPTLAGRVMVKLRSTVLPAST